MLKTLFSHHLYFGGSLLFATLLITFPNITHGVSEEDPNPGPPIQAEIQPTVTEVDVPTPANTSEFAPVKSQVSREPAVSSVSQPTGALTGRIVFTSPGHGWQWNSSLNRWNTDRGNNNQIVEDFGNHDQFTYYCNYLFNAGATVVPFRPIGNQTNEVVLDNDDGGVSFAGAWSDSAAAQYYGDPDDAVSYRFTVSSAAETAVATYRPNIPQSGFYPIYTWVLNSSNRSSDQLYRVNHSGGTSEVRINHVKVGRGWIYLGTYYLEAGTDANVEISNQSNASLVSATNVIADAIRFGNGMGDVVDGAGISGYPREDEGNRYWIQRAIGVGGDTSVYSGGNVSAPPRMSAYMNNAAAGSKFDRVYIGIHSNASGSANPGANRGAWGLFRDGTNPTPNQVRLATIFGAEVNSDMRAIGSPPLPTPWVSSSRDDFGGAFGEINNLSINNEMEAIIIETAFHDNVSDANIMRAPYGRQFIARAMTHATIKFFNEFGGGPSIFPPNTPTTIKAVGNGNGAITVSWVPPPFDPTGSGAPSSYVVYRSTNGYGFGNPVTVSGATQLTLSDVPANIVTYFRVASRNAAGESFPTETVAVRPAVGSTNPVLIVNGFDRLDLAMNVRETRPNVGTHDRVKPWKSNNFDYVVQHAKALHASNRYFDSASNEAVNPSLLSNYQALVWIAGEESTADETFSNTEQTNLQGFLNNGRAIMVSGAEIGWDLDAQGGGVAFYNNFLLSDYVGDNAGTYNVAAGVGLFAGISAFNFGPTVTIHDTTYPPVGLALYDVDFPDIINAIGGSSRVLSYSTGTGAAVAGVSGHKVVSFGFPFENITSEPARNQLMDATMNFFAIGASAVTDWSIY